ncbi:hypothetical protein M5K25_017881 [Dendrobium thyrsiflorum]|uniref:Aminotransferase-like plant mobile domain-containing protein n=1 Tax=Dendrobium thyrsiflorum TaxID=117978 RepID=A0ABD0UGR4_DENTH
MAFHWVRPRSMPDAEPYEDHIWREIDRFDFIHSSSIQDRLSWHQEMLMERDIYAGLFVRSPLLPTFESEIPVGHDPMDWVVTLRLRRSDGSSLDRIVEGLSYGPHDVLLPTKDLAEHTGTIRLLSYSLSRHEIGEQQYDSVFGSPFRMLKGYVCWARHILRAHQEVLKRAGVYKAIYASLFDYSRLSYSWLQALVEHWDSVTNTCWIGPNEMMVTLWDLHVVSGLPILGTPYEECIPPDYDLFCRQPAGYSMRGEFVYLEGLHQSLAHYCCLQRQRGHHRGATVPLDSWIESLLVTEAYVSLVAQPHDPFGTALQYSEQSSTEFFEPGSTVGVRPVTARGISEETSLVAFIATWLCYFIFPDQSRVLRPSTLLMAGVIATGRRVSLAPAVLARIYRGFGQIVASYGRRQCTVEVPWHYVHGWVKAEKPLQSNLFLPFSPLHDDGREPFFLPSAENRNSSLFHHSTVMAENHSSSLFHHSTVKAENLASSLFHHSTVKAENLASSLFHHSTVKAENLASSLFHHSTVKAENLASSLFHHSTVKADKAEKPLQSNLFLPFSPLHDDGREPFFLPSAENRNSSLFHHSTVMAENHSSSLFHHSTVKAENLASSLFHHSTVKAENLASSLFHHSTVKAENLASSLFHHSTVKAENLASSLFHHSTLVRATSATDRAQIRLFMFSPLRTADRFRLVYRSFVGDLPPQSFSVSLADSQTDRGVPTLLSRGGYLSIASYFVSMRPGWLFYRRDDTVFLEGYNPNRAARQFGFVQATPLDGLPVLPGVSDVRHFSSLPSSTRLEVAALTWTFLLRLGTGSHFLIAPTDATTGISHLRLSWIRHTFSSFFELGIRRYSKRIRGSRQSRDFLEQRHCAPTHVEPFRAHGRRRKRSPKSSARRDDPGPSCGHRPVPPPFDRGHPRSRMSYEQRAPQHAPVDLQDTSDTPHVSPILEQFGMGTACTSLGLDEFLHVTTTTLTGVEGDRPVSSQPVDAITDVASRLGVEQIASSPTLSDSTWLVVSDSLGELSPDADCTHSGSTQLLLESDVGDTMTELVTHPSLTQMVSGASSGGSSPGVTSHLSDYRYRAFAEGFHFSGLELSFFESRSVFRAHRPFSQRWSRGVQYAVAALQILLLRVDLDTPPDLFSFHTEACLLLDFAASCGLRDSLLHIRELSCRTVEFGLFQLHYTSWRLSCIILTDLETEARAAWDSMRGGRLDLDLGLQALLMKIARPLGTVNIGSCTSGPGSGTSRLGRAARIPEVPTFSWGFTGCALPSAAASPSCPSGSFIMKFISSRRTFNWAISWSFPRWRDCTSCCNFLTTSLASSSSTSSDWGGAVFAGSVCSCIPRLDARSRGFSIVPPRNENSFVRSFSFVPLYIGRINDNRFQLRLGSLSFGQRGQLGVNVESSNIGLSAVNIRFVHILYSRINGDLLWTRLESLLLDQRICSRLSGGGNEGTPDQDRMVPSSRFAINQFVALFHKRGDSVMEGDLTLDLTPQLE